MSDATTETDPLARLAAYLTGQGLRAEVTSRGLRVTDPRAAGCCAPHAADTVTCRPRSEDGGRPWFWTSWGEPIAEAYRIVDAALVIRGHLARGRASGRRAVNGAPPHPVEAARIAAEFGRCFPGALAWWGRSTGAWWAMTPGRTSR